MNDYNQQILKHQIDLKRNNNNGKMTDTEYLLNRELLEKANKTLNN